MTMLKANGCRIARGGEGGQKNDTKENPEDGSEKADGEEEDDAHREEKGCRAFDRVSQTPRA